MGERSHCPPNRAIALDAQACVRARRALGVSRETLSQRASGAHPLSVTTIKRAETGQAVYLESARRLSELLCVPLSELAPNEAALIGVGLFDAAPPAISVLPFRGIGDVSDCAHLATGLTEDLLARLSSWWFPVVASSVLALEDSQGTNPDDVRAKLRVRYWVEGSVQRQGEQARVIARLVDVERGHVLWTHIYERSVLDALGFQEEIATRIGAEVGQNVLEAEAARAQRKRGARQDAWELSVLGVWHFQRQNPNENRRARALLTEAIERDENLPLAWYTLAMTHRIDILNRWSDSLPESLLALHQTGERFAQIHPYHAGHHVIGAYVDNLTGALDASKLKLEAAIAIDPSHATAYSVLGQAMSFRGEGDAAVEQFELALRLRPVSIENWQPMLGMALAHFVQERYQDAVEWSERSIQLRSDMPVQQATLAASAAWLGDQDVAARAVARLRAIDPKVDASTFQALGRSASPELSERFFEGLRRAGLG